MPGNGNANRDLLHALFPVEADNGCLSFAPESVRWGSIELDEVNGRRSTRRMRDAVPQLGPDECEMRIAVSWFDHLLLVRQLCSKIDLVMPVLSAFRKQPPERVKELRHQ